MPIGIYKRLPKKFTLAERFWDKVEKTDTCWLWKVSLDADGYARLGKFKASRIAWELTYGTIPEGLYVCHHCDNRICVRPDHLFLGTQAENIHDMQSKRRGNYGERNGIAKLTEPDVIAIKFAQGLTNAEMSRHYHVSQSVISEIRKGTAWKYLNQKVGV